MSKSDIKAHAEKTRTEMIIAKTFVEIMQIIVITIIKIEFEEKMTSVKITIMKWRRT